MPRRVFAVPEIRRLFRGDEATALTAGGAASAPPPSAPPAGTISHNDLSDVWPDQHHAQGHLMASLTDHPDYEDWLAGLTALVASLATRYVGPLVIASDHSTPIVFDDILQESDGSDFIYASEV